MASIYDTVPSWSSGSTYNKYDIVKGSNNRFYYSVINSNSSNNPTIPNHLGPFWDGYILLNGNLIPDFWWKASYATEVSFKPKLIINQFGNGYQQRIKDGLNNNMAEFSVSFQNRSEKEAVSILHFLNERNAQESFVYNMPTIYNKNNSSLNTRFICPEWTSNYISYNNYSIQAKFFEVPI